MMQKPQQKQKLQKSQQSQRQSQPICIMHNAAFEGKNVGASENADFFALIHLPDIINPEGLWHYCPVISRDRLSHLYEEEYILCDAWYAVFLMEDISYYIPVNIVHPVHVL